MKLLKQNIWYYYKQQNKYNQSYTELYIHTYPMNKYIVMQQKQMMQNRIVNIVVQSSSSSSRADDLQATENQDLTRA